MMASKISEMPVKIMVRTNKIVNPPHPAYIPNLNMAQSLKVMVTGSSPVVTITGFIFLGFALDGASMSLKFMVKMMLLFRSTLSYLMGKINDS